MLIFRSLNIGKFTAFMLLFIPLSLFFEFASPNKTLSFVFATLSLIPLAIIIGELTKNIALQTNPTVSGLISATFGNIIELIIAILALQQGLVRVVQASIIGSIIANILLLIGLSILFGGFRFKYQHFNKEAASVSATMLIIAVAGLALPTIFFLTNPKSGDTQIMSDFVAGILAVIYLAGLFFSLRTHKDLFDASDEMKARKEKFRMSITSASVWLFFATIVVAMQSEILVGGITEVTHSIGIKETFIGMIVLAIITNIAEKVASIRFAVENKLDISLEIGMSSAIQVALFVVPILVFVSHFMGSAFSLVFSPFEIISLFIAVFIVNSLSIDGRCNWLEGAQLITVYLIIAAAFFFI
jgi:Ca2+:H+ antiporter